MIFCVRCDVRFLECSSSLNLTKCAALRSVNRRIIDGAPVFTLESVTYVTVGSSPRYNLFTSTTGRIIVHTATKYGTKPLRYVTFYFRDQRGLASLRHKNHAATTVLVCDEKSYRV